MQTAWRTAVPLYPKSSLKRRRGRWKKDEGVINSGFFTFMVSVSNFKGEEDEGKGLEKSTHADREKRRRETWDFRD